ncbi:hypothetical protein D3C71_1254490 [compost metagenome]
MYHEGGQILPKTLQEEQKQAGFAENQGKLTPLDPTRDTITPTQIPSVTPSPSVTWIPVDSSKGSIGSNSSTEPSSTPISVPETLSSPTLSVPKISPVTPDNSSSTGDATTNSSGTSFKVPITPWSVNKDSDLKKPTITQTK